MNDGIGKPWWKSRAMVAAAATVAVWCVTFFAQFLGKDAGIEAAAADATKVVGYLSPLLGALGLAGLRGALKVGAVLLIVVGLGACTMARRSSGDELSAAREINKDMGDMALGVDGPKSGGSSARTTTTEIPFSPSVAWGASEAHSTATSARYNPTNTNSGSGHLVTGFVLGAQAQTVMDMVADDPVTRSLAEEIRWIMESEQYTPEMQARLDALRKSYADHVKDMMASAKALAPNLANLETITVVGIIRAAIGHEEREPTNEEVQALSKLLPDVVSAARGDDTIQGKAAKKEKKAAEEEETDTPPVVGGGGGT